MIFPELEGSKNCYVNADAEAVRWAREHPEFLSTGANPLLNPAISQSMFDAFHKRHGVVWCHGGYLEDRRHYLRGSYLDASGNFLHLGVDCTVPQGTGIATDFPAEVMLVDDDRDHDGGWGMRVFLVTDGPVFVYAHLQNVNVRPAQVLKPGEIVAQVGGPPDNGNWHPHLHVQAIRAPLFHEILLHRFHELDGYGHPDNLAELQRNFPDPRPYLDL